MPRRAAPALLALEPVAGELQGTAVLRHDPDELIRGALRERCLDLERDRDRRKSGRRLITGARLL